MIRFSSEDNRQQAALKGCIERVSTQPCNHILVLVVLVVLAVHVLAKLEVDALPLMLTCSSTRERRRPLSVTMLISAGGPGAMASTSAYVLNGS